MSPTSPMPPSIETNDTSLAREAELRDEVARLKDQLAVFLEISTLGRRTNERDLFSYLMQQIPKIMNAERCTVYSFDESTQQLWSTIEVDGMIRELRLDLGEGIAGWVALRRRSLIIKDAYQDPRFKAAVDSDTGFRTRSVICQPMHDKDGRLVGVVQVLNKKAPPSPYDDHGPALYFSEEDDHLLSAVSNTVAVMLVNHRLYMEAVRRAEELREAQRFLQRRVSELDALHIVQRMISRAETVGEIIEAVAGSVVDLTKSDAAVISVFQNERYTNYTLHRRGTRDFFRESPDPLHTEGLIAEVLAQGRSLRRDDPDGLPPTSFEERARIMPRSVLVVPLVVDDRVFGAVKLINRRLESAHLEVGAYNTQELKLIQLVAGQLGTALEKANAEAERRRSERLSTMGRMLSGIAHDLKSPLTIASGYVQLMARNDDRAKRERYAKKVSQQFEDLLKMTAEVLSYARGETTIFRRTVHMHIFVPEIEELLRQEFANVPIELHVETSYRGDVEMDDGKVKRILFNLARNAREAMIDGGSYRVCFERDDDDLVIRCEDDGPGIPEEVQARVFQAFMTTGKASGTGLGLAIVKKLVEEHHGTVGLVSTLGEGTTFTIRLPVIDRPT